MRSTWKLGLLWTEPATQGYHKRENEEAGLASLGGGVSVREQAQAAVTPKGNLWLIVLAHTDPESHPRRHWGPWEKAWLCILESGTFIQGFLCPSTRSH